MNEQKTGREHLMRGAPTRVLVTGGAGFIGGHLVKALVAAGHRVRVIDDFSSGRRERLDGLSVEMVAADVRGLGAVRRAMDGVELVFHLAGTPAPLLGEADPVPSEEVNVCGALNVLSAAADASVRRVVLLSSGAVYGSGGSHVLHETAPAVPTTPGGVQCLSVERYAELYARARGVGVVTLRLFRAFGPGEDWDRKDAALVPSLCRALLEGRSPRIHGDGRQTRDFLYIDNVVGGLIAAGSARGAEGSIYNLASGESVSVDWVWEQLVSAAALGGLPPRIDRAALGAHEPTDVRVSIARAGADLGYLPAVAVREGLRRTLAWYRALQRLGPNGWFAPPDPVLPRTLGRHRPPPSPTRPLAPSTASSPSVTQASPRLANATGTETIHELSELDIEFIVAPDAAPVGG